MEISNVLALLEQTLYFRILKKKESRLFVTFTDLYQGLKKLFSIDLAKKLCRVMHLLQKASSCSTNCPAHERKLTAWPRLFPLFFSGNWLFAPSFFCWKWIGSWSYNVTLLRIHSTIQPLVVFATGYDLSYTDAHMYSSTTQQCVFYEFKMLKTDMMFENSFKKFKCFWETIIYFNFATMCHSFHKTALLLKDWMIFGHF